MKLSFLLYLVPSSVIRGPGVPELLGRRFETHKHLVYLSWGSPGSPYARESSRQQRCSWKERLERERDRFLFSRLCPGVKIASTLDLF